MFKTTTTAGDILSRQQTATLTANDATRVYGDVNPTLTATMSGINAIDAYVNSQFNDLYQATASTTATQASNVGSTRSPVTPMAASISASVTNWCARTAS